MLSWENIDLDVSRFIVVFAKFWSGLNITPPCPPQCWQLDTLDTGGILFTSDTIHRIRQTLQETPLISKRFLSRSICEWMDWRSKSSRPKETVCRKALVILDGKGLIDLPCSIYGYLGAFSFSSAAWSLKERDKFIGWTDSNSRWRGYFLWLSSYGMELSRIIFGGVVNFDLNLVKAAWRSWWTQDFVAYSNRNPWREMDAHLGYDRFCREDQGGIPLSGSMMNCSRLSNDGNMRILMVQRNWFQNSFREVNLLQHFW